MKLLLAIETTGIHLGLSLFRVDVEKKKGWPIATHFSEKKHRQSEELFPTLHRLLRQKRLNKKDIRFIAVDVGPGSFTGVRVGVAAARALAQALEASLIGISSLAAMAHAGFKKNSHQQACMVPQLKALENEIYGAAYVRQMGRLRELIEPRWAPEKEFSTDLAKVKKNHRSLAFVKITEPPHPRDLAELALQKILGQEKKVRFDYNRVEPLYLQPSWAERKPAR